MDDWSLLPNRNAVSEAAPDPQSTVTTTNNPCQTHPPASSAPNRRRSSPPSNKALDPAGLARQFDDQPGAEPRNPSNYGHSPVHRDIKASAVHEIPASRLDISRPFMDDIRPLPIPTRLAPAQRMRVAYAGLARRRQAERCRDSGHENSPRRSSRSGRVIARHRAQGILVVENAGGHAGLDDGLRAREIRWRPLRLARVRCERESVCVVRPLVLRSSTIYYRL